MHGLIDVAKLRGDTELAAMMDKGWAWTVFPWQVEEQFPRLPDIAQRALNASNSAPSTANELEIMASIAEFANMQAKQGQAVDWHKCIAAAIAGVMYHKSVMHVPLHTFTRVSHSSTMVYMFHMVDA